MKTRAFFAAALLAGALTACSGEDETPSKAPAAKSSSKAELAPVWQPKLDTASAGALAICNTPSSPSCATALTDIMLVVHEIEDAITEPGMGTYPESTKQMAKMQEATDLYVDEGCQGDPAADEPSSRCYGAAVNIAAGSDALGMTLITDDANLRTRS